jgi:adenylate cyclase
MHPILEELRRRRVFRVAVGYMIAAWVAVEVVATTFPHLGLPAWAVTAVIVLAAVGLPVALALAWAFDITPDGVVRTPSRAADAANEAPALQPADGDAANPAGPRSPADGDVASPTLPGTRRPRLRRRLAVAALVAIMATGVAAATLRGSLAGRNLGESIAVLPLENVGGDPENDYFSDGITEEILARLGRVEGLRVTARTASFRYRGGETPLRQVGRELGVDHVLTGSVRREGQRIRISVQLVNARDEFVVWSQPWDRQVDDILSVQEEIARAIVDNLGLRLTGTRLVGRYTDNLAAYDLYLQGRYYQRKGFARDGERNALRSLELFRQALALDSTYALAWAGIADTYAQYLADNYWAPMDAYPSAAEAADRAIRLDPSLAEAHVSRALVQFWWEWDLSATERTLRRAVELDPTSEDARTYLWRVLAAGGRTDAMLADMRAAARQDPRWKPYVGSFTGLATARNKPSGLMVRGGRFAARWLPGNFALLSFLQEAALYRRDWEEYLDLTTRLHGPPGGAQRVWGVTGDVVALARIGRADEARALLDEWIDRSRSQYVAPDQLAIMHAALGEKERAWELLEEAFAVRSATFVDRGRDDPLLDDFRDDPRFAQLWRRVERREFVTPD